MTLYFLVKYLHVLGAIVILGYMFGAAILAPDLWIEPLGALVKTGRRSC